MRSIRIPLHSRKHPGLFIIVDESDYDRVSQYRWYPVVRATTTYAARRGVICDGGKPWRTTIMLHRFVVNAPDGQIVDHINRNGLDNRRSNLRLASPKQNTYNRKPVLGKSSYKGVSWHHASKKWRATIRAWGFRIDIDRFDNEIDAALAYDTAARDVQGEFAVLNFPDIPDSPENLKRWEEWRHRKVVSK